MKTIKYGFQSALTFLLMLGLISVPASTEETDAEVSDTSRVIVVLKDSVDSPRARAKEYVNSCDCTLEHVYEHTVKGFAATVSSDAMMSFMKRNRNVSGMYLDRKMEFIADVPAGNQKQETSDQVQKAKLTASQQTPDAVSRVGADELFGEGSGKGINVAIIDSGVDKDHPDLQDNLKGGKSVVTEDPKNWDDGFGHGTHVAGTVAAVSNGKGVVGVAPQANLYGVRVLTESKGDMSTIIAGVDWVGGPESPDMDVANMSLGGPAAEESVKPMHKAIKEATSNGVTFVVAAGNDSTKTKKFIPARFDEVITVGAINDTDGKPGGKGSGNITLMPPFYVSDDTYAPFSNYGPSVDIVAPGMEVRSTWKGGEYNSISGTSMSSPVVAGAAAVLLGEDSSLSPDEVENVLTGSAGPAPGCSNGDDQNCGWGGYPDGVPNGDVPIVRPDQAVEQIDSFSQNQVSKQKQAK